MMGEQLSIKSDGNGNSTKVYFGDKDISGKITKIEVIIDAGFKANIAKISFYDVELDIDVPEEGISIDKLRIKDIK